MSEIYWFYENVKKTLKHINFRRMSGSAWKILILGECQEMPEICLSFSDLSDCSCKQVYKDPVVLLYV